MNLLPQCLWNRVAMNNLCKSELLCDRHAPKLSYLYCFLCVVLCVQLLTIDSSVPQKSHHYYVRWTQQTSVLCLSCCPHTSIKGGQSHVGLATKQLLDFGSPCVLYPGYQISVFCVNSIKKSLHISQWTLFKRGNFMGIFCFLRLSCSASYGFDCQISNIYLKILFFDGSMNT